jgi:hypothetical protein
LVGGPHGRRMHLPPNPVSIDQHAAHRPRLPLSLVPTRDRSASRGTLTAPGTDKGKRTDSDFRLSAAYDFASKASYTFRQAMPVRPAVLHRDILAVDEARLLQAPLKRCHQVRPSRLAPLRADRPRQGRHPSRAGVDCSVMALWLGHESIETTQTYLHAHLALIN